MTAEIVTSELELAQKRLMEERIKLVIREYIKRVLENCETLDGCTTDDHIDCPKCGRHRGIIWNGHRWVCQWSNCGFPIPEFLAPPSPKELEEIYRTKQKERRVREVIEFLRGLGIDLDPKR